MIIKLVYLKNIYIKLDTNIFSSLILTSLDCVYIYINFYKHIIIKKKVKDLFILYSVYHNIILNIFISFYMLCAFYKFLYI